MRDTPWLVRNGEPFFPADCLADGGDAMSCRAKRSDVLPEHNPDTRFCRAVPTGPPLDMSDGCAATTSVERWKYMCWYTATLNICSSSICAP